MFASLQRIGMVGVASAAICAAALVYLVWRNADGWSALRHSFDDRYLFVAFVFHACALLTAAYSWHWIVGAVASEGSLTRNVRIYVTSAFARRLPGSLWGPALRMYWYRRLGGDWRTVGVASVLEVWALTISGALIALIGVAFFVGSTVDAQTWVGLALVLVVFGSLFAPKVNQWLLSRLARLLRTPANATQSLRSLELARWVAIEFVNWICGGFMLAAILRALTPYPLDLIPSVLASWAAAGTAGMLITFVPGGFGVVELTLTGLLSFLVPTPEALAAAIGLRLFVTACELLWMAAGFAAPSALAIVRPAKQ